MYICLFCRTIVVVCGSIVTDTFNHTVWTNCGQMGRWEFYCRWELLVYYQNIFYVYDNLGHICEWRKEKDSKAMYHLKIGSTFSVLKELSCKKMKPLCEFYIMRVLELILLLSWVVHSSELSFRRFWLYSIDGVNNMVTVVAMCTLVR